MTDINNWIAVYAAIVATGALALEIRRWFESGPRIKVRVKPNMVVARRGFDIDQRHVLVIARNRGTLSTTITGLSIYQYPNMLCRLLRIKEQSFVVPKPGLEGQPPGIPHLLEPGTEWHGAFLKTKGNDAEFEDGKTVVNVHTSSRDRPYRVAIPRRKKSQEEITITAQQ